MSRPKSHRSLGWVPSALFGVLLVSVSVTAAATEPDSRSKTTAKTPPAGGRDAAAAAAAERKRTKAEVYTNDDLERLFGPAPAEVPASQDAVSAAPGIAPAAEKPTAEADPLAQMEADRAGASDRQKQIEDAERAVNAAKERVTALEKRLLAVKNPLLARPAPPEERAEEWAAMNNVQRLSQSEAELSQAREQLVEAEGKLRQLRAGS